MATANSTPMLGTQALDSQEYRNRLATTLGTNAPATPVVAPAVAPTAPVAPVANPTPSTSIYNVVKGDSLSKIASANKMTLQQLLDLNPTYKANPNLVQVGAKINLATPTPANPTPTPQNPTPDTPTKTPQQIADDNLAVEAGKAGLSLDQYKSLLESKNTVTKAESDAIAKELGITALEGELFKKPSQSSQQLFDSAYASAGLADLKNKIAEYDKKIAVERANLADAVGAIDENPFLTEATRVGRGKRALDQAEKRINNLLSEKQGYADLYNNGIKEIEGIVTRNQNDFTSNQQINTAQLNYLLKKAEVQAQQLKDKKTSESMGSVSSYLKTVQGGKAPTVIGNSESGFFKYDPTTGKFVQVVGQSAKTTAEINKIKSEGGGGDGSFKPTSEQKALVGRFVNSTFAKELGFTDADKARLNTDANFFYWALQKANEAGIY